MTGPVGYWHVDDIAEAPKALLGAGATTQQAVKDVGGGKLIASVNDADGNVIGLTAIALAPLPLMMGYIGRVHCGLITALFSEERR